MKKSSIILIIGAALGYLGYKFFLKGGTIPAAANKLITSANQALVDIKTDSTKGSIITPSGIITPTELPSAQTPAPAVNQAPITYIDPALQPFVADPEIVKQTQILINAIPFTLDTQVIQDGSAQGYFNRIMEIVKSVPAGELNYNPKYMPQIYEIQGLEEKIGALGYSIDYVSWVLVKRSEETLAAERQAAAEEVAVEADAARVKRQAACDEYAAAYLKANPEVGAEYAARVAALLYGY